MQQNAKRVKEPFKSKAKRFFDYLKEMFGRLKDLVMLQVKNKIRNRTLSTKRRIVKIIVSVVVVIALSAVMTILMVVINNILSIPIDAYFMVFILVLTQFFGIISCTIGITNDLFNGKDNQIILSLPARNGEVFFSKLIVYYIFEFIRNLYLLFPLLFAYGFVTSGSIFYYLLIIPMTLIIPMIATLIATLLSVVVVFVKGYLANHSWVSFVLSLLVITAVFVVIVYFVGKIETPIRIVQLYNKFITNLTSFMRKFAKYGLIYSVIGDYLYGIEPYKNFGIIIGVIVILCLLVFFIVRPLYFYLTSKSRETSRVRSHSSKNKEAKSTFRTFFKKEVTLAFRSPNEIIQNYFSLLLIPIFMYVLNYIFMGMNRSTFGNSLVLVINVFVVIMLATTSNTAPATAITTEGSEFVLLKTAPSDSSKIAWAKITFNVIVTTGIITIGFILFMISIPMFPKLDILFLWLTVLFINFGHLFWSFQIDVLSPKLYDYAQTGSLNDNANITKSLTFGFLITIVMTVLAILAFLLRKEMGWFLILPIAIVFFVYRLFSFRAYLNAFFEDIEY